MVANRVRVLAAAIGVALLCGAAAALQQPAFKAGNRTVAVYATVTNADGRLVPDLTRDAFTILDDKKRQDLNLFSNDDDVIGRRSDRGYEEAENPIVEFY